MPNGIFIIATRQKADALFETDVSLAAGGSITLPVKEVIGYAGLTILAFSNQAFSVHIEEACSATGTFVRTATLPSTAGGGGDQQVCERQQPCGAFARAVIQNTSGLPQTTLNVCIAGLPMP